MQKVGQENKWDQMMEIGIVGRTDTRDTREEIVEAMQKMKSGMATGPSEVGVEMTIASSEIEPRVYDGLVSAYVGWLRVPDGWKTTVIVPIFKGNGDSMRFESYRQVKLLERAIKIVKRVLDR